MADPPMLLAWLCAASALVLFGSYLLLGRRP